VKTVRKIIKALATFISVIFAFLSALSIFDKLTKGGYLQCNNNEEKRG